MIRVGVGGWTYAPWRGTFYPAGLPHARELEHASRQLTSIEINGTFYGAQKPESFARWRDETPDEFVFSVKAPRYATHRRELGEAGESIDRFITGGVTELGIKLGPILWQFPPTRRFDAAAFTAFVALLPPEHQGHRLRHVIEVRDITFRDPAFVALCRDRGVAIALIESDKHALIDEPTADFLYARLERNDDDEPEGYAAADLDRWAARLRGDASDAFVYLISGDKVRAPDAARALLGRLRAPPDHAGDRPADRPADRVDTPGGGRDSPAAKAKKSRGGNK